MSLGTADSASPSYLQRTVADAASGQWRGGTLRVGDKRQPGPGAAKKEPEGRSDGLRAACAHKCALRAPSVMFYYRLRACSNVPQRGTTTWPYKKFGLGLGASSKQGARSPCGVYNRERISTQGALA
jgi:hypothetical protein